MIHKHVMSHYKVSWNLNSADHWQPVDIWLNKKRIDLPRKQSNLHFQLWIAVLNWQWVCQLWIGNEFARMNVERDWTATADWMIEIMKYQMGRCLILTISYKTLMGLLWYSSLLGGEVCNGPAPIPSLTWYVLCQCEAAHDPTFSVAAHHIPSPPSFPWLPNSCLEHSDVTPAHICGHGMHCPVLCIWNSNCEVFRLFLL